MALARAMHIVDISGWQEDSSNSPYPEGAREKVAYISPEETNDARLLGAHRYLLKFSNERYPSQYWAELIAASVAGQMGVACPPTFLAQDPETGEMGSLVEWFYGESLERADSPPNTVVLAETEDHEIDVPDAPENSSLYVSGGNYMTRMIENYDLKKGTQHNLRSLSVLLTHMRRRYEIDFWPHWFGVFAFDALIGNTDRHQDNWGILWRRWGDHDPIPRFSPAFDNGTSLLHEIHDTKLAQFQYVDRMSAYVARGAHHIRFRMGDASRASHAGLLQFLVAEKPYLLPFAESVFDIDLAVIENDLATMVSYDVRNPLSEQRAEVILTSLQFRLQNLTECLDI